MKDMYKPSKDSGNFKMPADYFNQLEDEVMLKIITDSFPKSAGFNVPPLYFGKATESAAKVVFGTENHVGFVTPKGYLEDAAFETAVMNKIKAQETPTKVIPLKNFFLKQFAPIAVAASLALLVFFNFDRVENDLSTIAASDIEQWIDQDLISLNDSEILEVFSDVQLENEQFFDDEDVLDYLDDTNIEALLFDE